MIDFGNKKKIYSRREHEQYCREILEKAKPGVMAFIMDQDGTVKDGDDVRYQKANVAELLKKIARKGKYPSIITGSGVAALKPISLLKNFTNNN